MEKQSISIEGIPAVRWGPASGKIFLAVHGDQSHKEDEAIRILAEEAAQQGVQTLSFDLPEHGDRKAESRLCNPQNCVEDLRRVMRYARAHWERIGLFACSLGAYFSMLAYPEERLEQALFLSPVVDMERLIRNMMTRFGVSEERLEREREIPTPAKTLSWKYYQYVRQHPVVWNQPTAVLYGAKDDLCEFDVISDFVARTHAEFTILEDSGHFFHTEAQLAFLRQWLKDKLSRPPARTQ